MNVEKLQRHAELTIKTIESKFKHRGWTTGKKKWEKELLISAYEALSMELPKELVENSNFSRR
jgi:hypothetical protein